MDFKVRAAVVVEALFETHKFDFKEPPMQTRSYVLMLEEDPDDRQITEATLAELGFSIPVKYVKYSTELFEKLKEDEKPSLILVDYNSTPSPAIDILKELRGNKDYSHIPTIVLGEGLPPHLIRQCYHYGANSYITKPASSKSTKDKIGIFFKYWLDVVETA